MSGEEVKAYLFLLCASWLNEPRATLPDDDRELSAIACISQIEWMAMKASVMKNFTRKDGIWINTKLQKVSQEQIRNRKNGKKGGNPALKRVRLNQVELESLHEQEIQSFREKELEDQHGFEPDNESNG